MHILCKKTFILDVINRLTTLIYIYTHRHRLNMHISQVRKSALFLNHFVQFRFNVNRNARGNNNFFLKTEFWLQSE